jgi:ribose-phosphate pyrophosphokinase
MPWTLNLCDGFEPFGLGTISAKEKLWAGGEIDIRFEMHPVHYAPEDVLITTRLSSSHEIMRLLIVTDALHRMVDVGHVSVFFPYLPYARQDRVCHNGEAFSLEVFANLINSQSYKSVITYDVHSDVAKYKIDRLKVFDNHSLVRAAIAFDAEQAILVGPDAGSAKKIQSVWEYLQLPHIPITFFKRRSPDGSIKSIEAQWANLGGKQVYIVDDICDGGRTFMALAEKLKEMYASKIYLVASHGIFSYGVDQIIDAGIDHIYTTDSIKVMDDERVTTFQLANLLNPSKLLNVDGI